MVDTRDPRGNDIVILGALLAIGIVLAIVSRRGRATRGMSADLRDTRGANGS